MKRTVYIIISLIAIVAAGNVAEAQQTFGNAAKFDKTVHNFGDVMLEDGPQSCTFSVKNVSAKPIVIYSVTSSCGCTGVEWTREPIAPGACGSIKATYTNDEGAYPFEKSLTTYISCSKTPVILKIKGISHKKKIPADQAYPLHLGGLALKSDDIKVGNMEQGNSKSDEITVANISRTPLKVEFSDVDPDLSIRVEPNPIPAGSTGRMLVAISSNRSRWGKNYYYCSPVVDGRKCGRIGFWAITKENFDAWTDEQVSSASKPVMDGTTHDFGKIHAGKIVEATFTVTNAGKSDLVFYKADSEDKGMSAEFPSRIKPGARALIKVRFDSTGYNTAEHQVSICLYSNSPARPLLYLFMAGTVE